MTTKERQELQLLSEKQEKSHEEQSRYDELSAKEEIASGIAGAIASFMQDQEEIKNAIKTPMRIESEKEDGALELHKMLIAIKQGKLAEFNKAADPMTVGTAGDGGYLVPALTESVILEKIPTFGQARQFMQTIPMSGNVLNLPRESALPTAYWVGENESITASKPTLTQITLTPKKLAGLVVVSNELLEDANPSVANYILNKIAQVFGVAEDAQFFDGSGSPMTGIFASGNTFGSTVTFSGNGTTVTYDNLIDITEGVDPNYLSGASWFFSRSYRGVIRKLKDDQNMPIWNNANAGGLPELLGYPVNVIEQAPSTATSSNKPGIILGNLSNSMIGDIAGLRVELLKEATIAGTSLAVNDLTAIRVIKRVAFSAGLTDTYSMGRQAS